MLELITQAELAVDELIDLAGRATIEAVLKLSAQELAGPKHPGKAAGRIRWHGQQKGTVALAERKLRVDTPHVVEVDLEPEKIVIPLLEEVRRLGDLQEAPEGLEGCEDCRRLEELKGLL